MGLLHLLAVLNICNHLAFDSRIHLPIPYPAYPRDHQMHHRFPQCNYSTLTTMCDRAFGSYRSYKALGDPIGEVKKPAWYETKDPYAVEEEENVSGRPEAVPSPKSVLGLLAILVLGVCGVESFHLGGKFVPLGECVHFIRSAIVLVNIAVICYATESAAKDDDGQYQRLYMPKVNRSKVVENEAVPDGHVKKFRGTGGKEVWKTSLKPAAPVPMKRE